MSTHQEVAYEFVCKRKYTGSRMFCEDTMKGFTVFSYGYHFPIARHTDWGYAFNKDERSVSTTRHKNCVMNAISGTVIEFVGCDEDKALETFKQNLGEIKWNMDKMERARTKVQVYQDKIEYLLEQNKLIKERYLKLKMVEEIVQ